MKDMLINVRDLDRMTTRVFEQIHKCRLSRGRRCDSANRMPGTVSNPPAVCLLISAFHPRVGGGETHARLLGRELKALGTPVFVLTRRHDAALPAHDVVDGVPVERVGPAGAPRLGKYLMLPATLAALIRRRADYDILYVCGLRVLGISGMLAGLLLRKRVVLRAEACGEWSGAFITNSAPGEPVRLNPVVRALLALRNRLYRKADRFLAISRVIRDEFRAGGLPDARIATITNGIDLASFHPPAPEARARLRAQLGVSDAYVFAYAGKLNRGKGLEMLLRAWVPLAAREPRARLMLIGGGGTQFLSCETELRSFVAANQLDASVIFTGYTDRVADHLHAADAFVFPSENEALGLALIEGMACGLPALASATGGILDIIEDQRNGRLLPVGDEQAWRDAMLELMANPETGRRWAEAGIRTAREKFAIRAVAREHIDLFRTITA